MKISPQDDLHAASSISLGSQFCWEVIFKLLYVPVLAENAIHAPINTLLHPASVPYAQLFHACWAKHLVGL